MGWWRNSTFQLQAERGSAMLAALLTIVVLLLAGASAFSLAHLERMIARRHVEYLLTWRVGYRKARRAIFDAGVLITP